MKLFNLKLKIRHKLFLAILVANCLLVGTIYAFGSWIFDTSFRDYLDQTEATRLAPLAIELANEYSIQNNWQWAESHRSPTWRRLVQPYMTAGTARPRQQPGNGFSQDSKGKGSQSQDSPYFNGKRDENQPPLRPGGRPQPKQRPLLLRDQNQQLLIGPPHEANNAYWIPIKQNDVVIGHLGFVRQLNVTSELDLLFTDRIKSVFSWMILGILFISAIISIPLSRLLVRPIEKLKLAMHALTSGNFKTSLNHKGNDEIAELMRDFNVLSNTLDQSLTLRQQWIADISHELRTPVAVLQGELEALQDGIRQFNKPSVDSLHQEILRLSRLVNDLHELSLSDLGALSYQKTTIDVIELLKDVIEQHQSSFESQSIEVSLQLPNDYDHQKYQIHGDFRRLEQLFTNLANNTRHYTQSPGSLNVTIQKQAHQVLVSWSDSAPGAAPTDIARLFDRLFRVDASRNRNTGGSGLGLSICQNIVSAHQGSIEAKRSELGGVSIIVTFPLLIN
ncbi:MAG: two-component system sensor histidine kinase BaeS [Polaribacter sp.]|jgi:two-component system sensor histidine kinase BaeS